MEGVATCDISDNFKSRPYKERSMSMGTHWIDEGCINCAACAEVCPVVEINEQGDVHVIDKETCVDCGACDSVCPVDVIKWEITA